MDRGPDPTLLGFQGAPSQGTNTWSLVEGLDFVKVEQKVTTCRTHSPGFLHLKDGTPILDIKPYIPYADCHPEAIGGFAAAPAGETLEVVIPPDLLARIPENRREALRGVLAQDPRPHYQDDPERIYGFTFAGMEIKFRVETNTLTITDVLS